jgi:hypothetical protein
MANRQSDMFPESTAPQGTLRSRWAAGIASTLLANNPSIGVEAAVLRAYEIMAVAERIEREQSGE